MSRIIQESVQYTQSYQWFVAWARQKANIYPEYTVENGSICSNVRIEREGIWYKILCVEMIDVCAPPLEKEAELRAYVNLVYLAHNTQNLYMIGDRDKPDEDQTDEAKRLKDKMPWLKE